MKNNGFKKILKKFIKYGIGGGIGAILDLILLWFFTEIGGIYYIYSSILSFSIVFIAGFLYQKHIAFESKIGNKYKQGVLFLIFQLIGMGLNILLLWIFATKLGFYYLGVAIINKAIIYIWNFTMNYKFTFK